MRSKTIVALLALYAVSACDASSDNASVQNDSSNDTQVMPTPNYTETKKGIYYYASVVSENDKMSGKAAGDVLGFRYKGKNKDGDFVVQATDGGIATCSDPCKIVHFSDGETILYTTDSVIGAVFSDAMNGFLKSGQ